MAQDTIKITGIKTFGYHGVFETEKSLGQEFIVDIEYKYETNEAIKKDAIELAIDYGAVISKVKSIVEIGSKNLIETVADQLAIDLLSEFKIDWVKVTLHKPHAPVDVSFKDISIVVERSK
ncbi:MAG: dihydroneopterin aldolase [Actinomycetota bacterium]|jgi:dihydroneopterin aldolase